MLTFARFLALTLAAGGDVEPEHAANAIFRELMDAGFVVGSAKHVLPPPRFRDGQKPELRRAALQEIAGSPMAADELLRDSVSAPFILKLRDEKLPDATIRVAELWFVVHADFDTLDPSETARQAPKPTEAANMRFETKILTADEVAARKLSLPSPTKDRSEWYAHLNARLLDRIGIDSTDQLIVTRSTESIVVASKTAPAFSEDSQFPNRWQTLNRSDPSKPAGPSKPYVGGVSYVKISKLGDGSDALLVEGHFAFLEPAEWFDRGPVLRSKFGPVAQDQIRRLRRQAADAKKKH